MALKPIPFSPPDIREEDIASVADVLRSGWITTGPRTRQFEVGLADVSGTADAVALASATAGMEAALRGLGIGPGDEVIVPAYTYTATASVVHHVGARAVIVDTRGQTPHLRPEDVESAITPRTKAVIPVDLAGIPADHAAITELVAARSDEFSPSSPMQEALGRVAVVADAAHSVGAAGDSSPVGTLADFTCYSFHAVKNLATGEGGAITWADAQRLGSTDADLYSSLRRGTLHGQTKDALQKSKGGSWDYDIVELGQKANMTDIQSALGVSQLARLPEMLARRRAVLHRYAELLADSPIELIDHFAAGQSSAHLAIAFLEAADESHRNQIINELSDAGISTNVHYKPLSLLTAYQQLGWKPEDTPHAVEFFRRAITLPLHTLLTDDDVDRVGRSVAEAATAHAAKVDV
ncbi:DegT/DnrJ/EryC1/StrS aminotransferase family protein [Yimella radicis]